MQIKIWLSISRVSNGFACKLDVTATIVLFSKFLIFTSIFFLHVTSLSRMWAVQKGRQFDVLCEKISLRFTPNGGVLFISEKFMFGEVFFIYENAYIKEEKD